MNVAIIGASRKPDRYSHKAQRMLMEKGHLTFPVSLSGEDILERKGYTSILDIPESEGPVDTATIYMNPERFAKIAGDVSKAGVKRVIFNPGTESPVLAEQFQKDGIHVVEACTLVLLATGEFDSA